MVLLGDVYLVLVQEMSSPKAAANILKSNPELATCGIVDIGQKSRIATLKRCFSVLHGLVCGCDGGVVSHYTFEGSPAKKRCVTFDVGVQAGDGGEGGKGEEGASTGVGGGSGDGGDAEENLRLESSVILQVFIV